MAWTTADIPDLTGRHAIVTGTGGIGLEVASALAGAGADVVVAGRDPTKGGIALERIRADHPDASVRFETLDLASLASVTAFAARMLQPGDPIDILIANAGIMALPRRQETEDGFERQLGVNYLGHFALVGLLLPLLRLAEAPRVATVSSLAHRGGHIRLDDLQSTKRYRPFTAYSQSKLAMLMFALELQRRSDANGWNLTATAAHPGGAKTDLIANGPGRGFGARIGNALIGLVGHSAAAGALPILYSAVASEAVGGGYYGPHGMMEFAGPPGPARIDKRARDEAMAAGLWDASQDLTVHPFSTP